MKVLEINNEHTWRGGERQTLLLAAGLQERGIEVTIACRPGAPLWVEARNAKVPTAALSGGFLAAAAQFVCLARGYDLLHCQTGRSHSLAIMTRRWHRKPVVVSRRVDFVPKPTWFNHYKYATAARIICVSQFIARQLREWGVPENKLKVVYEAVPPLPGAGRSSSELRTALDIPPGRKVVGNIAALVEHKDHATLLRAAQKVVQRRADVVFLVLGEGKLKDALLTLRHELGLDDVVRFAGFRPQAQQYLPAFDVFVMSSRMEGLGTSILDAFNAGIPVAATAAGGIPELVRNGETGLLAPVGDADGLAEAILVLLEDRDRAARLSAAAREFVGRIASVPQMVGHNLAVYEAVLAEATDAGKAAAVRLGEDATTQ